MSDTDTSSSSTTRDPMARLMLAATGINDNPHLQSTGIGRAASKVIGLSLAIDSLKALGDTFLVPFLNTNSDKVLKDAADKAKEYAAQPENKEKLEAIRTKVVDTGRDSLSSVLGGIQELIKKADGKLGAPGDAMLKLIEGFNVDRAMEQSKSLSDRPAPSSDGPSASTAMAKAALRSAEREGRN